MSEVPVGIWAMGRFLMSEVPVGIWAMGTYGDKVMRRPLSMHLSLVSTLTED